VGCRHKDPGVRAGHLHWRHSGEYDVFIFFTYLYWHTWAALPKVADRAILVPLAHDEWTIY